MTPRNLHKWFHNRIHTYNVFIPDENDYDAENDIPVDPATAIKHQRYATRLYVPLFVGKHRLQSQLYQHD